MKTNLILDRNVISVAVDETVHVMVELTAPEASGARRPIDLVAVVDRSGSMHGEPLAAVRDALDRLTRLLGADDRLGLVTFDDTAQTVLALDHHEPDRARAVIEAIEPGGSTNLSAGMFRGLELFGDRRPDATRAMIVLSDGHANAGIVEPDQLGAVCRRATGNDVRTSTIGFGDGFDEELMGALADQGRGDAHWCEGPEAAEAIYRREFDNLADIVAQNLTVAIRPQVDEGVITVFHDQPIAGDDSLTVELGDAYAGETRRLVFGVAVPGLADLGDIDIAELELRWVELGDDIVQRTVTMPLTVATTDDPDAVPEPDPRVREEVEVLAAAKARDEARRRARDGDINGSRAALRLHRDGLAEQAEVFGSARLRDEADALSAELDMVEDHWDEAAAKTLWAASRTRTRGRPTRGADHLR